MGQNALQQAQTFHSAVKLDSVVMTKLDGTAKGGIVFAIAQSLGLPLRFIGVGEQFDDLQVFDAGAFVDALLGIEAAADQP
jgi:fused signal recognition particle receptor